MLPEYVKFFSVPQIGMKKNVNNGMMRQSYKHLASLSKTEFFKIFSPVKTVVDSVVGAVSVIVSGESGKSLNTHKKSMKPSENQRGAKLYSIVFERLCNVRTVAPNQFKIAV